MKNFDTTVLCCYRETSSMQLAVDIPSTGCKQSSDTTVPALPSVPSAQRASRLDSPTAREVLGGLFTSEKIPERGAESHGQRKAGL